MYWSYFLTCKSGLSSNYLPLNLHARIFQILHPISIYRRLSYTYIPTDLCIIGTNTCTGTILFIIFNLAICLFIQLYSTTEMQIPQIQSQL